MHFDVVLSVFIHPYTKKRRRAQFSIHAELTRLSVCVRFRCVHGKLLTQRSTVTSLHALAVTHRQILYENVDSAKIKVPFYTTDIDILCVASMHRTIIHCIDIYWSISMNRYTPIFLCIFDQINATLVNIRDFVQRYKKNSNLNGSVK